jgi:hypothetical protein
MDCIKHEIWPLYQGAKVRPDIRSLLAHTRKHRKRLDPCRDGTHDPRRRPSIISSDCQSDILEIALGPSCDNNARYSAAERVFLARGCQDPLDVEWLRRTIGAALIPQRTKALHVLLIQRVPDLPAADRFPYDRISRCVPTSIDGSLKIGNLRLGEFYGHGSDIRHVIADPGTRQP